MAKRFDPGQSYRVKKDLQKNCYFFKDPIQIAALFRPLLAHVTEVCKLICHDYLILPNGYQIVWTMPEDHQLADVQKTESKTGKKRKRKRQSNKSKPQKGHHPGGIPEAMCLLNTYLNRYLRLLRPISGPIFEEGYTHELIATEEEAILQHVQFRTMAQVEGFSSTNEYFGEAIMPCSRIGDSNSQSLSRPECIGSKAQIAHNLTEAFPLMPILKHKTPEEVRRKVQSLTRKARELINRQKEEDQLFGYLEQEIEDLEELPTPRPSNEVVINNRPRIDFDWLRVVDEDTKTSLIESKNKKAESDKLWNERYKMALEQWRLQNYDFPFPIGTYKMRVFHNCNIGDPPNIEKTQSCC